MRQNQILKIVEHFDFDVTCDVIGDPDVNNIRLPAVNFLDTSNAIWIM